MVVIAEKMAARHAAQETFDGSQLMLTTIVVRRGRNRTGEFKVKVSVLVEWLD